MPPVLLSLCLFLAVPALALDADGAFDALFWDRNWSALEAKEASGDLSPREVSLVANGLWFQGRWAESLSRLNGLGEALPAGLRPYREMLNVLGLERTDRKAEALERARALWGEVPDDLRYYVAYALARLEPDPAARHENYLRMADGALEKAQLRSALKELVALPGATVDEALRLVELEPRNAAALKILSEAPAPLPDAGAFALGYAAYLRGKYETAVDWLSRVPDASEKGDRARFYRGYSLYRLKRDGEALDVWHPLLLKEGSYARSALRRVAVTASRSERAKALALLGEAAAKETSLAAAALLRLAALTGGRRARSFGTASWKAIRRRPRPFRSSGIGAGPSGKRDGTERPSPSGRRPWTEPRRSAAGQGFSTGRPAAITRPVARRRSSSGTTSWPVSILCRSTRFRPFRERAAL
ncbi:tetratricopeptide repeat protein [Aminithiophilus ramosus]|uniref:tetratricopeptide repeat protein n=1 Tax=Aminithiophilus ramosus TaxID=3029084 RepID=UPI00389903EE